MGTGDNRSTNVHIPAPRPSHALRERWEPNAPLKKGLLYRLNYRAKHRDFGTRTANGHIEALNNAQRHVQKQLEKWNDGGCNNRNWPGGTPGGLQVAEDLATMPDPATGARIPRIKGVHTHLSWSSWVGGYGELIGSRFSGGGSGGIANTA